MEVVEVEDAHQQEGGGDEDPGEEHGQAEGLQPEVVQSVHIKQNKQKPQSGVKTTGEMMEIRT